MWSDWPWMVVGILTPPISLHPIFFAYSCSDFHCRYRRRSAKLSYKNLKEIMQYDWQLIVLLAIFSGMITFYFYIMTR